MRPMSPGQWKAYRDEFRTLQLYRMQTGEDQYGPANLGASDIQLKDLLEELVDAANYCTMLYARFRHMQTMAEVEDV